MLLVPMAVFFVILLSYMLPRLSLSLFLMHCLLSDFSVIKIGP
jgi:hypothetical protein